MPLPIALIVSKAVPFLLRVGEEVLMNVVVDKLIHSKLAQKAAVTLVAGALAYGGLNLLREALTAQRVCLAGAGVAMYLVWTRLALWEVERAIKAVQNVALTVQDAAAKAESNIK